MNSRSLVSYSSRPIRPFWKVLEPCYWIHLLFWEDLRLSKRGPNKIICKHFALILYLRMICYLYFKKLFNKIGLNKFREENSTRFEKDITFPHSS